MTETTEKTFWEKPATRVTAIMLIILIILCGTFYFAFRKLHYSPLYQNLGQEDATSLIYALKEKEIGFRLKNEGQTIMVPSIQADELRLELSDHQAYTKNISGFELFDESEMGLTEFAQKIKFQRALQGELARTIMMIEDIRLARVHLTIPERSLFKAEQQKPKATVTLIPRKGYQLSSLQIEGIQRLVSQSVSDLTLSRVVVINQSGAIISPPSDILAVEDQKEFYDFMLNENTEPNSTDNVVYDKDSLVLTSLKSPQTNITNLNAKTTTSKENLHPSTIMPDPYKADTANSVEQPISLDQTANSVVTATKNTAEMTQSTPQKTEPNLKSWQNFLWPTLLIFLLGIIIWYLFKLHQGKNKFSEEKFEFAELLKNELASELEATQVV